MEVRLLCHVFTYTGMFYGCEDMVTAVFTRIRVFSLPPPPPCSSILTNGLAFEWFEDIIRSILPLASVSLQASNSFGLTTNLDLRLCPTPGSIHTTNLSSAALEFSTSNVTFELCVTKHLFYLAPTTPFPGHRNEAIRVSPTWQPINADRLFPNF